MNQVNLIGRLGNDPDFKYTPGGVPLAKVNLAINEGYGAKKKTIWVAVTFWSKVAETVNKYVKKGTLIRVEGRLGTSEYKNKMGKTVKQLQVTGRIMEMIGSKADSLMHQGSNTQGQSQQGSNTQGSTMGEVRGPAPIKQPGTTEIPF